MLGHQSHQVSLQDIHLWSGKTTPLIDPDTFHGRFAVLRSELLRDEDFAGWYARAGRPSVPPSVVAGAFLLALREGCSDRETEQRMRFDLRWKWALGLGIDDHGCDHTSICVFRARLLAHGEEGKLFTTVLRRAVDAGLLPRRTLQVMDSSPMLGAAAVQDTYTLIRTALHKVVKAHENHLPAAAMAQLRRYVKTGKAEIDWNDAAARKRELTRLVQDAYAALAALPETPDRPTITAARELLARVAGQDVEDDGEGGTRIRQGVAKDRVFSTVDTDARHGHKSSAGRWNGYKKHVSVEPSTELITSVAVTPANAPDGPVALDLLEQQAAVGLEPAEVAADMAYAGAGLRADALARGAGTMLITREPAERSSAVFPKNCFEIDCDGGSVTCPAGQTVAFTFQPGQAASVRFPATTCTSCTWAPMCLSRPGQGRLVGVHPHEDQLQAARQRREQADFASILGQRPIVERKQAHWNAKGGRRSRYMGQRKTRMQALCSAAVVNLERLMVIRSAISGPLPVTMAASA